MNSNTLIYLHPAGKGDESALYIQDAAFSYNTPHSATDYESVLAKFDAIKASDIYLLNNKDLSLDTSLTLEIAYAMQLNKPIILTDVPLFIKETNLFLKNVSLNRLSKIMIANLNVLDNEEKRGFILNTSVQKTNYRLTRHETTLISSHIKAYFRTLVSRP